MLPLKDEVNSLFLTAHHSHTNFPFTDQHYSIESTDSKGNEPQSILPNAFVRKKSPGEDKKQLYDLMKQARIENKDINQFLN